MDGFWNKFDLTQVLRKIEQLEKILSCGFCEQIFHEGEEWFLIKTCRHQLCQECCNPENISKCPVCHKRFDRNDLQKDKSRVEFLRELNILKKIFVAEKAKNNTTTLEKESLEPKIIFDADTDIDLNDRQVDVNRYDGGLKINENETNQTRNEGDNLRKTTKLLPKNMNDCTHQIADDSKENENETKIGNIRKGRHKKTLEVSSC